MEKNLRGQLGFVKMAEIDLGERRREEYGDVESLALSINKNGLIHPIAVQSDDGKPPYRLAAGGRRFIAHLSLGRDEIACRIYDHPLSKLEIKLIELLENIDRKDLTPIEDANLKRDIHETMVEMHGEKHSTAKDASGWSKRDTAKLLNKSIGNVVDDIKLATMAEAMPELNLDKCKTKNEATKTVAKIEESLVRGEIAKRAETALKKEGKKLADNYLIQDFFEGVKRIPDESINLCEIDPPYAIKLQQIKKAETSYNANYGDTYNEVKADVYTEFMNNVFKECFRVMAKNSWMILWFAPEPWFEMMYQGMISAGFHTRRITAIWKKGNAPGQTNQPTKYLPNSFEHFFYASKGNPKIVKPGRSSIFDFPTVPHSEKIHPTERPVALIEEVLQTFCWEGSRILVPFAGSGNTLLAANNSKMFAIGFDLSQAYKDGYVARILTKEEEPF